MPLSNDSFNVLNRFYIWVVSILIITGCQNFHNIRTVNTMPTPATCKQLTVMTYNIRVGYGGRDHGVHPYTLSKREENLLPIVAAIQSIDPDIVGLQEVRGYAQARKLAEALDMNYSYIWHDTGSRRPVWWGVAVLSKYPILNAEGIQISSGRGNTKSALICTVDVGGQSTTFICIHKDKDLKDGVSFKVIMRAVNKIDNPIVLIGDLNMHPYDRRLKLFQPRFIDTATETDTESAKSARNTGTFIGIGRIDYVLVDSGYIKVIDAGVISREYWDASDHLAYFARIILKHLPSKQRGQVSTFDIIE